jgi:hypothetical protein
MLIPHIKSWIAILIFGGDGTPYKNRGGCHILLEIINCVYLQDKSLTLEPHEFKMCLISLGYNLKEGEKVSDGSSAQLLVFLPCFSLLKTTAVRVTGGGGGGLPKQRK